MPSAILVDLDDTLLDNRYAMSSAITGLRQTHDFASHLGATELAKHWIELTEVHWRRYRDEELSFHEQRRERLRAVFARAMDAAEADHIFDQYIALYERHWRLLPGAAEFLAHTADKPMVIVSNGERGQAARKVRHLAIEAHFVEVVTPELAGAKKPRPEIFAFALAKVGAVAQEALMIGDDYDADIAPAAALGMATFHVQSDVVGQTIRDAIRAT
jgi:putative hydrolase of the HAD superfamily